MVQRKPALSPPLWAGLRGLSRPRRGKEFPADSAWCRFLSHVPCRFSLLSRDAVGPWTPSYPWQNPGSMQSRLLLLRAPGGRGASASRRVLLLLRQVVRGRPGSDGQRSEVRLLHAGAGADAGNPGAPAVLLQPALGPGLCWLVPRGTCQECLLPGLLRDLGSRPDLPPNCCVMWDKALALSGLHSVP